MDLDANTLRGIATILCMIAATGITLWAYSERKREDFNEAANLPFADEETEKSRSRENRESGEEAQNV